MQVASQADTSAATGELQALRAHADAMAEALEACTHEMDRIGDAFSRKGGGCTTLGMASLRGKRTLDAYRQWAS